MKKVFVSGSLAYDRIMDFDGRFSDHILPDKIHMLNVSFYVKTFRQGFGGTAGNIAYNLSLLNESPFVVAAYGSDFTEYKKWLQKKNVNISYSKYYKNIPTASAYIITDKGDNQITGFFPGAMQFSCASIPATVVKKASIAVVAPGNLIDMRKLPVAYKKAKLPYIYDPGQQITILTKKDLISGFTGARALISNDYELSLIQKKTGYTLDKIKKAADLVITTRGEKGSVIHNKKIRYVIPPAKPKNTSDPTGAGDAYRAGLIKGLLSGYSLPRTGRLAAVVSVYTVEKYGTQTHRFTWSNIQRRYYTNFKGRL